jgi:hypothetical protein
MESENDQKIQETKKNWAALSSVNSKEKRYLDFLTILVKTSSDRVSLFFLGRQVQFPFEGKDRRVCWAAAAATQVYVCLWYLLPCPARERDILY